MTFSNLKRKKTYHSQFVRCTCCKATLSLRLYPEELDHCFAWGRTSVDWLCVSGSVWPWLFLYIYRSQITYCSAQGLCPKLLYQDSGLAKGGGVQWSKWHFFLRLVLIIYILYTYVCVLDSPDDDTCKLLEANTFSPVGEQERWSDFGLLPFPRCDHSVWFSATSMMPIYQARHCPAQVGSCQRVGRVACGCRLSIQTWPTGVVIWSSP